MSISLGQVSRGRLTGSFSADTKMLTLGPRSFILSSAVFDRVSLVVWFLASVDYLREDALIQSAAFVTKSVFTSRTLCKTPAHSSCEGRPAVQTPADHLAFLRDGHPSPRGQWWDGSALMRAPAGPALSCVYPAPQEGAGELTCLLHQSQSPSTVEGGTMCEVCAKGEKSFPLVNWTR